MPQNCRRLRRAGRDPSRRLYVRLSADAEFRAPLHQAAACLGTAKILIPQVRFSERHPGSLQFAADLGR